MHFREAHEEVKELAADIAMDIALEYLGDSVLNEENIIEQGPITIYSKL